MQEDSLAVPWLSMHSYLRYRGGKLSFQNKVDLYWVEMPIYGIFSGLSPSLTQVSPNLSKKYTNYPLLVYVL